ncbi:Migration and invasion enhancer 1 [Mactra antiquata]
MSTSRHSRTIGVGDNEYDALRDAEIKFRQNPGRYTSTGHYGTSMRDSGRYGNSMRDTGRYSTSMRDSDRYSTAMREYDRSYYESYSHRSSRPERVTVVIEHWSGCMGKSVANDIIMEVRDYYPDVKVTEYKGRVDSFEVFINGKLLYSRIMQGGYPYAEEVLDGIYRAKHGKKIHQVDRVTESSTCTIL